MRIKCVEIHNYKRLSNCKIEFGETKTLFVGANNSGKTSAMHALRHFLGGEKDFTLYDFTASNWKTIDAIGADWFARDFDQPWDEDFLALKTWDSILPFLDIWLEVEADELQFIPTFIPSLEWDGEPIGLRILLDPEGGKKKLETLAAEYIAAKKSVKEVCDASSKLKLWPESLSDYLKGRNNEGLVEHHFALTVFLLDPTKHNSEEEQEETEPDYSYIRSQAPLSHSDLKKLFQVDYIEAQRGFSDTEQGSILTGQFRAYYDTHLNEKESPDKSDVDVLQLLQDIENTYDCQLSKSFQKPLEELGNLGYPGFHNPKPTLNVKLSSFAGLEHNAAVEHSLCDDPSIRLPDFANGMGYQNLIFMTFAMMSFRDSWMRVGKRGKRASSEDIPFPRLHLVLIEEPEAHLHAQVQRVFVERAYATLRKHDRLGDKTEFTTQLAISTHSSCIVMGADFCDLRYFRRAVADLSLGIPFSSVVNMHDTFLSTPKKGKKNSNKKKEIEEIEETGTDTRRFATRYIRSTHCDLFFADAIIIVEGNAERMLLPRFIHQSYPVLDSSYLSILEIGGSHAYRMLPLIEKLGLPCLIITDLDSANGGGHHVAEQPKRREAQITTNNTLKNWFGPAETTKHTLVDELLTVYETGSLMSKGSCPLRVAYQGPVSVKIEDGEAEEYLPYTFEDALIVNNLEAFKNSSLDCEFRCIIEAIEASSSVEALSEKLYDVIKGPKGSDGKRGKGIEKAAFVLDLIESDIFEKLNTPSYIADGLTWLQKAVQKRDLQILSLPKQQIEEQPGSKKQ